MKISRIENAGQIQWQVVLNDDEITPIIECLMTGIIGDRHNDTYRIMAGAMMVALLSKVADTPEIKGVMSEIRNHHAPGRFIVDVTEIARQHTVAKGEK